MAALSTEGKLGSVESAPRPKVLLIVSFSVQGIHQAKGPRRNEFVHYLVKLAQEVFGVKVQGATCDQDLQLEYSAEPLQRFVHSTD